jgi:predicted RNA-binding protein with PIN domain
MSNLACIEDRGAVKLLVDGYNLLKLIKASHISDKERSLFVDALSHYSTERKLEVILIFDGGISTWPQREVVTALMSVVYAGNGVSADSYIKDYIAKNRQQDLLLVSTDRHLNRYAAHYGVPSVDAADFLQFVRFAQQERTVEPRKSGNKENAHVVKFEHEDEDIPAEVDALMHGISQAQVQKKVTYLKNNAEPAERDKTTLSKKERILKKKLDKL